MNIFSKLSLAVVRPNIYREDLELVSIFSRNGSVMGREWVVNDSSVLKKESIGVMVFYNTLFTQQAREGSTNYAVRINMPLVIK